MNVGYDWNANEAKFLLIISVIPFSSILFHCTVQQELNINPNPIMKCNCEG